MDSINGKLQTKVKQGTRERTDIHLKTDIDAVEVSNEEITNVRDHMKKLGMGFAVSKNKPDHPSVWFKI